MAAVVIVEPEIPENTGFIARLASNFEFDLRIVNPEFNLSEARGTASKAQEKLREARIYSSVEEAIEDLDYIIGTKPGKGISLKRFQPRENSSIMIGRESSGLSNEELGMCDALVHIDTGEYSSLNQSHAAAVVMHHFHSGKKGEGIDQGMKEKLDSMIGGTTLEEVLLSANPAKDIMGRVIGELRSMKKSDSQSL
ncbi:MAG: RNA methyltransferase [Candidatus Nanohaloarchaea archaeon]